MKDEHFWNDIRESLFRARMYHQCWWYLAGAHDERYFCLNAMGQEWPFFSAAESACWEALISRLASVFDNNPKSISLRSIRDLATHPLFEKNWERGRLLYKYRSKAVAHRDSMVARQGDGYGFGLCRGDVKLILDASCMIFDERAVAHGHLGIPDFSCGDNLRVVLAKIADRSERGFESAS